MSAMAAQKRESAIPQPTSDLDKSALTTIEGSQIPLLVFVNSRSGGQQGKPLLERFSTWLGKEQVVDLAQTKPEDALRRFAGVADLRVLVCGGDGTCGWLMTAMETVGCKFPMATMPLGTGNDLARCLRWGHGLTSNMKRKEWLRRVAEAQITGLDRWRIRLHECASEVKGLPRTFRQIESAGTSGAAEFEGVFNNYLGIGIEAHGMYAFHTAREANPSRFSNRLKNQALMGALGLPTTGLCVQLVGSALDPDCGQRTLCLPGPLQSLGLAHAPPSAFSAAGALARGFSSPPRLAPKVRCSTHLPPPGAACAAPRRSWGRG
jgi:hypothetical protein